MEIATAIVDAMLLNLIAAHKEARGSGLRRAGGGWVHARSAGHQVRRCPHPSNLSPPHPIRSLSLPGKGAVRLTDRASAAATGLLAIGTFPVPAAF
jgi:hypothetical protein